MDLIAQLGTDGHAAATEAFVSLGESAVTPLCEALSDPSWRVAAGAAFTLGKIGSPEAIAPLVLALKADCFFVRGAVVWALGQLGGAASVVAIIELLRDNRYANSDPDLVALGAEAIGRFCAEHPAEAAPLLDSLIDREGEALPSHRAALEVLSRVPDELAIAPLVLIMCLSKYCFEDAEDALGQIGISAAKAVIDALSHFPEQPNVDFEDGVVAVLKAINDVRVVDLLMDHVQENIKSDWTRVLEKMGFDWKGEMVTRQYGRRITERMLEIAINPRNEEESRCAWDWIDTFSHDYIHRSPSARDYPHESLGPIVQTVTKKHDANIYSDDDEEEIPSEEEVKDTILQALTVIAAIAEAEGAPEPQPLQRETSKTPEQNSEEFIVAMLNRQSPILKALESQSPAEAVQYLRHQVEENYARPEMLAPLFKAMVLIGPEAIESLYILYFDTESLGWVNYAHIALKTMNIPAYGAEAVPHLLHALRLEEDEVDKKIWEYLVAIGPSALPGIEAEIRADPIDIFSLFNIREKIIKEYNVVLDASSESFLGDFIQAIQYSDVRYAERFIIANPDLIHMDINGKKALEIAVVRDGSEDVIDRRRSAEMVEMLLTQGADINAQNQEGNTALHLAVMQYCNDRGDTRRKPRVLLFLLQSGAVQSLENNAENTAWNEAFESDAEAVCFWLDEAKQLQHASKMKIEKISYTLNETDEELEVCDIVASDGKGENITLDDREITSYRDYFLGRRNYYGGLGNFDDNPIGKLVWNTSTKRISPAPEEAELFAS